LPLLGPPIFEPSPNAHTRIEVSRLDIYEMERRDPLWWLHSCVLRLRVLTDRGGVEFVEVRKGVRAVWMARWVDEVYP
jgi:hypothetical protein